MLTDLFGYYKRNVKKMDDYQVRKELNEIKRIEKLLQEKLGRVS